MRIAGWLAAGCLVLCGCAAPPAELQQAPAAAAAPIPIEVMKPEGAGPFPAVVILHDCSGLGPRSSGAPARWAKVLLRQGYVVLIPDSFTTRGHASGVCTDASASSRAEVSPARRVADAHAALDRARALPYVDGVHVGVMGGSHGGSTTLLTMDATRRARAAAPFAAAIALYPGCNPGPPARAYKPLAPLLILAGEKDDWTPAEPCRVLAEHSRAAGDPVVIKVYPGAYHAFDSDRPIRYVDARVNRNSPTGHGATTGGNAEAWADSIREVTAFFAKHLRR